MQFEKVQRKTGSGMEQLPLQVQMAKLKMNDGIWVVKCEIKRLIFSMLHNENLIIARQLFFISSFHYNVHQVLGNLTELLADLLHFEMLESLVSARQLTHQGFEI